MEQLTDMAATSYYSIKEDKILYSGDDYARRRRQRQIRRRKIKQRKLILTCGAILAATIIVVAATTGTKPASSVPVESVPPTITQDECATCDSTITSTTSTEVITTVPPTPESTLHVYDVALSLDLQQYTYETCISYGIEDYYSLVISLMWVESRYNASAISATNDYGLMQINKGNHSWLREELGISNFLDARENIKAGVYMLSGYLLKYDIHKALMAYNMGTRGASKVWNRGIYTSQYSRCVVAAWTELKETNTIKEK